MILQKRNQTEWEQLRRVFENAKETATAQLKTFCEDEHITNMQYTEIRAHAEWALMQMDLVEAVRKT